MTILKGYDSYTIPHDYTKRQVRYEEYFWCDKCDSQVFSRLVYEPEVDYEYWEPAECPYCDTPLDTP